MTRILAGDLSATFNIDGLHLQRFVARRNEVVRALCDYLLLHDQILVPTQDYLTAAGLVRMLGERNVADLLEQGRLRFARLRGTFAYVRGTGRDGRLVAMMEDSGRLPASAVLDRSVEMGLGEIRDELKEFRRLKTLLLEHTAELPMGTAVDATFRDAYADLKQSHLWKRQYLHPDPDLLELPRISRMSGRVLGPGTNVSNNVVDACLALGLMNIELYLAKEFECATSATGSPMGDCVSLKLQRLVGSTDAKASLWNFLTVAGVPDISGPLLADGERMAEFIRLTGKGNAQAFRTWFHSNAHLSENELLAAYIDALRQTSWIQSGKGRALRMVASLGVSSLGFGPAADAAISIIDNFVLEKYLRRRGAKFFVEDMRTFSNRIKPA